MSDQRVVNCQKCGPQTTVAATDNCPRCGAPPGNPAVGHREKKVPTSESK